MPENKSTITAMPQEWVDTEDSMVLKPKSGQQVTGDATRIAKACKFTMDRPTSERLQEFLKAVVGKQLTTYKKESDVKDITSVDNLKANTNGLNVHIDIMMEHLKRMKEDTSSNVLDGFDRKHPEKGKKLMETTTKNHKVLMDLVGQSGKKTVDHNTKLNIFITGKTGVLAGSSDFEKTKKEKYLGIINVGDNVFSGTLYIPKTFGKLQVIPNSTIRQINSLKKEYVIVYTDEKNKLQEKKVTDICEESSADKNNENVE